MMRRLLIGMLPVVALVLGGAAVPAAAGTSGGDCTTVRAKLIEYKIKLSRKSADAGCVTFKVVNQGVEDHELVVTKAKRARDLPEQDGIVEEDQITIIGETEEIATTKRKTLTVDLEPGKYVLFCNLEHEPMDNSPMSDVHGGGMSNMRGGGRTTSDGHFGEGMHRIFTVK